MNVRNAERNDLKKIVEIYNSTIPSRLATADTEPISVESRESWFDDHNERRPLWMVEDERGQVTGWVSFQSFYGRPAYNATVEVSIYIDVNHRGKGLGKQILQYCISSAANLEIKTLLAFIFAHNSPSLKLFRHFGFENWGILPDIAVLDGQEKTLIILGKRIHA